jgi:hypothetical protein
MKGPGLRVARDGQCAAVLANGTTLLFGGQDARHHSLREVEVLTSPR